MPNFYKRSITLTKDCDVVMGGSQTKTTDEEATVCVAKQKYGLFIKDK